MMRRTVLCAGTGLLSASFAGCLSGVFGEQVEYQSGHLAVVVDGDPVDLTADRFQSENAANDSIDFHLHEGHEEWYAEGDPVTFAEAIDLLPHFAYERVDGADVLTVDGTTYDGREAGTEITFVRNGDPVDPTAHEVQHGDDLRVEVETGA